jgi:uncharacterized protein YraI
MEGAMARFSLFIAVLTGLSAFGVTAADAATMPTARATATLTVYAGPGYGYAPIGQLPKDAVVELGECTPSGRWCSIAATNPEGWVIASYLVGSAAKAKATPYRPLVNPFYDPWHWHPRWWRR